jgi:23S rRNA pseudouridine1911/1915/1917 synthase
MYSITVGPEQAGRMVKHILQAELKMSRRLQRELIRSGGVTCNGKPIRMIDRVQEGDIIKVVLPKEESEIVPETMPLDIRYEDDEILVVNKPPGMLAHPTAYERTGTLLGGLVAYLKEYGQVPHSVHRLDRDTSGLLMYAKTAHSHHLFDIALRQGDMHRAYLAIVYNPDANSDASLDPSSACRLDPNASWQTIDLPIASDPSKPSRRIISADGQRAVTHYRLIAHCGPLAIAQFRLETGRTHQIRLHCASYGMPLVGDPDYDFSYSMRPSVRRPETRLNFPRQALHAYQLSWRHPIGGQTHVVQAEPPADMRQLWQSVGGDDRVWGWAMSLPLTNPL